MLHRYAEGHYRWLLSTLLLLFLQSDRVVMGQAPGRGQGRCESKCPTCAPGQFRGEYWPSAQLTQCVAFVTGSAAAPCVPAAQLVQDDEHGTLWYLPVGHTVTTPVVLSL